MVLKLHVGRFPLLDLLPHLDNAEVNRLDKDAFRKGERLDSTRRIQTHEPQQVSPAFISLCLLGL